MRKLYNKKTFNSW